MHQEGPLVRAHGVGVGRVRQGRRWRAAVVQVEAMASRRAASPFGSEMDPQNKTRFQNGPVNSADGSVVEPRAYRRVRHRTRQAPSRSRLRFCNEPLIYHWVRDTEVEQCHPASREAATRQKYHKELGLSFVLSSRGLGVVGSNPAAPTI